MFRTADGETLVLAPWRMRRLLDLLADARRYPPGTQPATLMHDLRLIVARARRVSTQPRLGTARFESADDCCRACLLTRQQRGVLALVGLSLTPAGAGAGPGHLSETLEFESMVKSADVTLDWQYWPSLQTALNGMPGRTLPASGVYLLVRGRTPVYVGMSQALAQRMRSHRWCEARHRDSGIGVWTAALADANARRAVEHAMVRILGSRVSNDMLRGQVRVGDNGLRIRNFLPQTVWNAQRLPPDNQIRYNAGATFEV